MKPVWTILFAVLLLVMGGSPDAWAKKGRSGHDDQREARISDDSGHHGRRHGGEDDGDRHGRRHGGEDDGDRHGRRHGGEDDSGHHGRHGQGEIEVHRSSGHR